MKRKNIKEVNIQDPSPGDLVLGDQDLKNLDQGIIKIKKVIHLKKIVLIKIKKETKILIKIRNLFVDLILLPKI